MNAPSTSPAAGEALQSIVVAGGGAAGWLSAAALAATFAPQRIRITLIDAPIEGGIGGAVATFPDAHALHQRIGLEERDLLTSASATYKLGVSLDGWRGDGRTAFLPHGPIGEGPSFHQYWLRAGGHDALSDYAPAAVAALQSRFAPQIRGGPAIAYGLHLDADGYLSALRAVAAQHGVIRMQGALREVRRRADDGFIEGLVLDNGRVIEGDFYVDCTGAASRLLGSALGVAFEDWSGALPCNSALIASKKRDGAIAPFTHARALSAGWLQTIPLQNRLEHAYFYADRFISDSEAAREMAAVCGVREAPAPIRFRNGMRQESWRANCAAIGVAAAVLEPLHGISEHVAHRGIARLISLLPRRSCDGGERDEYNRLMRSEVERMRDFLIMHFLGAERPEPFWRECVNLAPPEELQRKRDVFASRGRVTLCDEEAFLEQDWAALLLAMGPRPQRLDVRASAADPAAIRNGLQRMRERIAKAVEAMPLHQDYIAAAMPKDAGALP